MIAKIFLKLLIQYCPPETPEHVFLEELFGVQDRIIGKFRATDRFKMPGLSCESSVIRVQGIGYRKVHRGQSLIVRFDRRHPDIYDVSFMGGVGGEEQWFQLTASQWLSIQTKLEPEDMDGSMIRYKDKLLK